MSISVLLQHRQPMCAAARLWSGTRSADTWPQWMGELVMPSSTFRDRGGLGATGIFSDAPRAFTFTIPSPLSSLHQATFPLSNSQRTRALASVP